MKNAVEDVRSSQPRVCSDHTDIRSDVGSSEQDRGIVSRNSCIAFFH